jgi:uncharacterized membrane protein
MHTSIKASLVASAVLGLIACASQSPTPAAPSGTTSSSVKCQGINSCKGQAECAGPGHPCGKHTACKGQGWLTVPSAEECKARGGTVL